MFYRSGNKARKCMEPRHTGPEFHSELELDYTDNAIYLIWKWERVKLVDAGPRHFSQSECSLQTIQLCIDCTHLLPFQKRSWGKTDKPSYQGFLGNTGGRKICWKFRSSNEENSNLYQLVFSRWQNRYLSVNQSLEILKRQPGMSERNPWFSNQLLGFPGGSDGKESACSARHPGSIPGSGRPLEEGMATYSSTLAWRIPGTEEPGRLQSVVSHRVRHDWAANTFTFLPMLKRSCNYFLSVQHFLISKIGKTILNSSGYHAEFNTKGEEPAWC